MFVPGLNAQNNYLPGYIISTEGDTIFGHIKNTTDDKLVNSIDFKRTDEKGTEVNYPAFNLIGFRYENGRTFKSIKVKNENSLNKTEDSIYIFAKNVVRGKIDLFSWLHSKNRELEFIMKNNESMEQIQIVPPKVSEVKKEGTKYNKYDQTYKLQIASLKGDQNQFSSKGNSLKYSEKDIAKDIYQYNLNFEPEFPAYSYKERTKFHIDLFAGVPLYDDLNFRVGLYGYKTSLERTHRLLFMYGLIYSSWSDKNKELEIESANFYKNYSAQSYKILPLGFRYQYPFKNIIPYCHIGLGYEVNIHKDYVVKEYQLVGEEKEVFGNFAINAGVGAKFRIGSGYIFTEITPVGEGIIMNLGYSI
ncbi:hypothetical protein DMZ48_12965 [Robertkochia solimangrovi]|nr:hypothetical protein DMZ48_12965 [Robertkochia solimangrovi]